VHTTGGGLISGPTVSERHESTGPSVRESSGMYMHTHTSAHICIVYMHAHTTEVGLISGPNGR